MLKKTRDVLLVLATVLTLSALAGCFVHIDATGWDGQTSWGEGPKFTGSGIEATEARELDEFDAIALAGSVDVEATIGSEQKVEVSGDDNLIEHCITEVEDGTLKVRMEHGSYRFKNSLKVTVTVPALHSVQIAGSSDVNINGFDGESLSLAISGSGDIRANGTVDELRAAVSGSGDMRLTDLVARAATVSVSGSGDVRVNATERLDAAVVGSGDIRYRGDPTTSLTTSGSGSIRQSN